MDPKAGLAGRVAKQEIGRLCLGIKPDGVLWIGDAKVTIVSPCAVRVIVEAPKDVPVVREEVKKEKAA